MRLPLYREPKTRLPKQGFLLLSFIDNICSIMTPARDPGLDTLLDPSRQTLFVDDGGHWVKFVVVRTEVTPDRPKDRSPLLAARGHTCALPKRTANGFVR